MARAVLATLEAVEIMSLEGVAQGPVQIEASFDELNLDILLRYRGAALVVPDEAVDVAALLDGDDDSVSHHMRRVAARLIARSADRVVPSSKGAESQLLLHFAH